MYISDFDTADKAAVELIPVSDPDRIDLVDLSVRAAVSPGSLESSDRLSMPARDIVKEERRAIDGQEYLYLRFPSETLTNSGYNIKRKNFVSATVKRGTAYVLVASSRFDKYDDAKAQQLAYIAASFRVR